jgi:hypothetical protein
MVEMRELQGTERKVFYAHSSGVASIAIVVGCEPEAVYIVGSVEARAVFV